MTAGLTMIAVEEPGYGRTSAVANADGIAVGGSKLAVTAIWFSQGVFHSLAIGSRDNRPP
jgi:hypothetical protein